MPLSGMPNIGAGIGSAVSNVGSSVGGGGVPGQTPGDWYRGLKQNAFESAPKSQQFGMLKGLLKDTAQSRGLKLSNRQASAEAHGWMRGLMDLGSGHQEAASSLHQMLQDVKDKQIGAPKGSFDPNAKQAPGESVYVPTPGTVDPALNKKNVSDAFGRALDPNAPVPTDPAGMAANKTLMGNLGAERLREASPTNWGIQSTGTESPVNLIQSLRLPKHQRPGESGKMGQDPQGAPLGAYQQAFQPSGKGDPLQEEINASKKGGQIPWIVAEAYKHGVGGTVGQMATDPQVGASVFQQSVLQPYAEQQRNMLTKIGDLYDRYLAGKGKKGNIQNPLTTYGLSRSVLGIPPGQAISGDAIRKFAFQKYGDGQTPGYFLNDPTRKDSFPALLDAGLKRIQGAQKAGTKLGGDTGALYGGGYLTGAASGGFPTGASASSADPSSADPYSIVPAGG